MPYMLSLTMKLEVVSGNSYLNWHWSKRSKYIHKCIWLLRALMIPPVRPPTARQRVTFTAYRLRTLDRDNLSLGLKPLRDALTRCNYIEDDSEKCADFVYNPVNLCKKGEQRVTVTISELP